MFIQFMSLFTSFEVGQCRPDPNDHEIQSHGTRHREIEQQQDIFNHCRELVTRYICELSEIGVNQTAATSIVRVGEISPGYR
jgi:hypothetical protein